LNEAVNAAVEMAHRGGILSAASLMISGPAAADAVERTRRMPGLHVGLHLVLADGPAASAPARIAGLIDGSGWLRRDLLRLGLELALRPSLRRQMATEIRAQFEAFRATGLALDHVNAHRHFHVHPVIADLILAVGAQFGMSALRVPSEPTSVLARIEPAAALTHRLLMQPWSLMLRKRVLRAKLLAPDAVFGLAWSGRMTTARLSGILCRLPDGLVEIYLHPATSNAFPGSARGYRYTDELAALTDPECIAALRNGAHRLGGYSDFRAHA
jgi:hopanoid biosynthesis associated protein HpnK